MKKVVCVLAAALALGCASCGKTDLYPVAGKVTYHGVPAAGATVSFIRQGDETQSDHVILGAVQEDGSFELVCGALGKGAPAGTYDVLVVWRPTGCCCHKGGSDKLKGRYADPRRPLLHATVDAKTTILPPFELMDRP
jgi:hypothetical protein